MPSMIDRLTSVTASRRSGVLAGAVAVAVAAAVLSWRPRNQPTEDVAGAQTAAVVNGMFDRLAAGGGWNEVFLETLGEDLVWTVTGSSPISGTYHGKQAYVDGVFARLDERLETWPQSHRELTIIDGEWATVLFDSTGGRGVNGTDYTMRYAWLMRVDDGKIREVIGFYDQVKVAELFA